MEDMLKNRLAHIKPRDIVDKNLMAISNLLEVLSGLAEGKCNVNVNMSELHSISAEGIIIIILSFMLLQD